MELPPALNEPEEKTPIVPAANAKDSSLAIASLVTGIPGLDADPPAWIDCSHRHRSPGKKGDQRKPRDAQRKLMGYRRVDPGVYPDRFGCPGRYRRNRIDTGIRRELGSLSEVTIFAT